MPNISIIVPLAAGDDSWRDLLPLLPEDWELLMASCDLPPGDWKDGPQRKWLRCARAGRGAQMNAAAGEAAGEFLWFVHADSRPAAGAAAALEDAVRRQPHAVHYFDLRFYDGGPKMRVNEWGAFARCALFGNPFGDQALCVSRSVFAKAGGYPESSGPGEDHLFVLRAARMGARARRVRASMLTSARSYAQGGWWRTVVFYQKTWWRQWRAN